MMVRIIYLLPPIVPFAHACGVLTHNQIVQRSSHLFSLPNSQPQYSAPQTLFSPLLNSAENFPSIQAGAFFPDWGYQCFSTDDDAEAAHWPPFLVAAVEYVTEKYGFLNRTNSVAREDKEQKHLESLIAFIFAIASHQTADATWHAIRLPTGLLDVLAGVDFDGDYNSAHSNLDIGGDLLAAARLGRLPEESRYWISNNWQVPIDDLIAIYDRMGRSISKYVMRYCCMRGLAALKSEMALGSALYGRYAAKSPMMVEEIDTYYLGGIREMAARTVGCWQGLMTWFSGGVTAEEKQNGGWEICDVFQAIKAHGGAGPQGLTGPKGSLGPREEHPHRHSILEDPTIAAWVISQMETITVSTDSFGKETYTLPQLVEPALPAKHIPIKNLNFEEPVYVATYVPYGHLGSSIAAGYFGPTPDELAFAVGAPGESEDSSRPGEGNVYIIPNGYIGGSSSQLVSNLTLSTSSNPALAPASVDQRFGSSTSSLRALNRTFLAVSAPGPLSYDPSKPPSVPFSEDTIAGRVKLFLPGKAEPEFTFTLRGAELGGIGRRQWGDKLSAAALGGEGGDENEWLIISGSRSDGERLCEGRRVVQWGEGEVTLIRLSSNDATVPITSQDIEHLDILHRRNIIPQATTTVLQLTLPDSARQDIPCNKPSIYASFGFATAFSSRSRIIWVSAPGIGSVFGYRLSPVSNTLELVVTIKEPEPEKQLLHTNFGHALATGVLEDGTEFLAVSSPNEDLDNQLQAGVVRIYTLDSQPGSGSDSAGLITPTLKTLITPEDNKNPFTKFGRVMTVDAVNKNLWISSEFAEFERGRVWGVAIGELGETPAAAAKMGFVAKLRQKVQQHVSNLGNFAGLTRLTSPTRFRGPIGSRDSNISPALTLATQQIKAKPLFEGLNTGEKFGAQILTTDQGDVLVCVPDAGVARERQEERFYGAVAVFRRKKMEAGEL
ncbi:hypothetical protein BZA77DRAFT_383791 [Pyronema omphalodes]|nr:hypothetical protein BZA77DRAFT_383791 [Pyronema omphalodes]